MKIYFAGNTCLKKREEMILTYIKNRLLSYHYLIIDKDPFFQNRGMQMIKEINENQDK